MKEIYGYVYIIENLINHRKYIGQHKYSGLNDKKYMGSGKILRLAIEKYGIENFKKTVIQYAFSKEELNELEKYYIKIHNAVFSEEYYNIISGGIGGAVHGKENV